MASFTVDVLKRALECAPNEVEADVLRKAIAENEKRGSGILSQVAWSEARTQLIDGFKAQLRSVGMSKAKVEDMAAGFADGMLNALSLLQQLGVFVMVSDSQERR
jgi:hypothetical protein